MNFLKINYKEIIFLTIVLVTACIVRLYKIDTLPYGIEGDELSTVVTSFLSQHGIDPSTKGIWSLHYDLAKRFPVYPFFQQVGFTLFGNDVLAPRIFLAFTATVTLFFFYLFSRQFITYRGALIILILYSFSTYKLISNRIAYQYPYSDFFVYPVLLCAVLIPPQKNMKRILVIIITSILTCLSLFTYNLTYMLPIMAWVIVSVKIIKINQSWKYKLLEEIIFLAPILLLAIKWIPAALEEAKTKSYALNKGLYDFHTHSINVEEGVKTISQISTQLFDHLGPETADMLIAFSGPLINIVITILAIIGICIGLIKFKKYWILIIWFTLNFLTYQIILSLYLPRMWFITIGAMYLLAGITIQKYLSLTQNHKYFWTILFINCIVIIYADIFLFMHSAAYNSSFKDSHREIVTLTKNRKNILGKDIVFIGIDDPKVVTSFNSIHAVETFYYLAKHPYLSSEVKDQSSYDHHVYTIENFTVALSEKEFNQKIIVIDNELTSSVTAILKEKNYCPMDIKKYEYFTELMLLKCK